MVRVIGVLLSVPCAALLLPPDVLDDDMMLAGACMADSDVGGNPAVRMNVSRIFPLRSAALAPSRYCSSEEDHIRGNWVVRTTRARHMTFTSDPDNSRTPVCDKLQADWQAGGRVPPYDLYEWKPDGCTLAAFDRRALCRRLNGKLIGVVGDSTSQHFAHTLMGLMCGHVYHHDKVLNASSACPAVRAAGGSSALELCRGTMFSLRLEWLRIDRYPQQGPEHDSLRELVRRADVLVLNWGVHFISDGQMRSDMENLTQLLQADWQPKRFDQIFWRSTIVAAGYCSHDMQPLRQNLFPLKELLGTQYHQEVTLTQERMIAWPAMRSLGVRILRVFELSVLRPDAHRLHRDGHTCLDCLHFCEPGPVNAWLTVFFNQVVYR